MTWSLLTDWKKTIYEEEFDLCNTKFSPKELLSLEDEDYNSKLEFIFCGKAG